jgi:hypothetical protein
VAPATKPTPPKPSTIVWDDPDTSRGGFVADESAKMASSAQDAVAGPIKTVPRSLPFTPPAGAKAKADKARADKAREFLAKADKAKKQENAGSIKTTTTTNVGHVLWYVYKVTSNVELSTGINSLSVGMRPPMVKPSSRNFFSFLLRLF